MVEQPQRGGVYLLPAPEQDGKQRPYVVVSRDDLNRGGCCLAVPFYSKNLEQRRTRKYCVFLSADPARGVDKDCVAKADEVSLISVSAIDWKRGLLGRLKVEQMREIVIAIRHAIRDEDLA